MQPLGCGDMAKLYEAFFKSPVFPKERSPQRPHLRIISALQANYSHSSIWHLGFNSLALLSFGESRVHSPL